MLSAAPGGESRPPSHSGPAFPGSAPPDRPAAVGEVNHPYRPYQATHITHITVRSPTAKRHPREARDERVRVPSSVRGGQIDAVHQQHAAVRFRPPPNPLPGAAERRHARPRGNAVGQLAEGGVDRRVDSPRPAFPQLERTSETAFQKGAVVGSTASGSYGTIRASAQRRIWFLVIRISLRVAESMPRTLSSSSSHRHIRHSFGVSQATTPTGTARSPVSSRQARTME